jgi:hypothetical protein
LGGGGECVCVQTTEHITSEVGPRNLANGSNIDFIFGLGDLMPLESNSKPFSWPCTMHKIRKCVLVCMHESNFEATKDFDDGAAGLPSDLGG